jgi:hypothetical protein
MFQPKPKFLRRMTPIERRRNAPRLRKCYEKLKDRKPGLRALPFEGPFGASTPNQPCRSTLRK